MSNTKPILFTKYIHLAPGETAIFERKPNENDMRYNYRAWSLRTTLKKRGMEVKLHTSAELGGPTKIECLSNKNYKLKPVPPLTATPAKATAVPAPACRITREEQDARDFFAQSFVSILALESAEAAYAKAKQATELFRRHIAAYKD